VPRPTLVGCCGWGEAQAKYVTRFPVVELQTPFYEPPTIAVASRWRALAPPEFQFCLKAWQLITHTPASPTYRRLKSPISLEEKDLFGSFRPTEQVWLAWERTREIARILRASIVVFQCPASFVPSRENIRNFHAFFSRVEPESSRFAWEPRGDWPEAVVRELCSEYNLIHCVDPLKTMPVHGDATYWRLHGRGGHRYRYTDADFDELEIALNRYADLPGPAYVMFNNVYLKDDALRFMERLSTKEKA
jgi:uncharacterized protein YecE (DUF72 family)